MAHHPLVQRGHWSKGLRVDFQLMESTFGGAEASADRFSCCDQSGRTCGGMLWHLKPREVESDGKRWKVMESDYGELPETLTSGSDANEF